MSSHRYTNILTIVPIPDHIEKDDGLVESLVELKNYVDRLKLWNQ
jgi:hypothetical protein